MKYLTHSAVFFTFLALVALIDVAYGASCDAPDSMKGHCNKHLQRYSYNKYYNFCFSFIYGGCGATENIFNTWPECYEQCVKDKTTIENDKKFNFTAYVTTEIPINK